MPGIDPTDAAGRFVEKWSASDLSERAASQEHFIDLCRLLGQPTPAEADPTGKDYCFEKPVKVTQAASKGSKGDSGFVDVWKRGYFAWEYKRKDKYKSKRDRNSMFLSPSRSGLPIACSKFSAESVVDAWAEFARETCSRLIA